MKARSNATGAPQNEAQHKDSSGSKKRMKLCVTNGLDLVHAVHVRDLVEARKEAIEQRHHVVRLQLGRHVVEVVQVRKQHLRARDAKSSKQANSERGECN